MPKSRLSFAAIATVSAGLLASCDNGGGGMAQEEGIETSELTGFADRTFTGNPIPQISVTNLDGETLELASLEGPALINIWATWCDECEVELPLLDALASEVSGQVRIITISGDLRGAEVVGPYWQNRQFTNLPSWIDQPNDLALAYRGAPDLPLTILYDANGNEVWRMIGAYDWSTDSARDKVLEALTPVVPAPRVEPSGDVEPIIRE